MGRRTVYCVQSYKLHGVALVRGDELQKSSETEARAVADALKPHVAGLIVYSMEGYPDFAVWDDPRIIATYGRVPVAQAA